MNKTKMICSLAAPLLGTLFCLPAWAEEIHWKAHAAFAVTNGKVVTIPDKSDHNVGLEEYDGVVFSDGEKPFLDHARYQVVSLFDTGGETGGYKIFTDDGGAIWLRFNVMSGSWPKFHGEWTALGGTQKYKGITGKGTFDVTYVSDTAAWDVFEGGLKTP
jgi:hypothetical protein